MFVLRALTTEERLAAQGYSFSYKLNEAMPRKLQSQKQLLKLMWLNPCRLFINEEATL